MQNSLILSYLSLVAFWTAGVISPGPNFMATISTATSTSRRAGYSFGLGIAYGSVVWSIVCFNGISYLLEVHSHVYSTVTMTAGILLLYLGYSTIHAIDKPSHETHRLSPQQRTCLKVFFTGLFLDLSNSTAGLSFSSLFASVIPPQTPL